MNIQSCQVMSTAKIPRILHYCWFGGNPLPPQTCELLETWRRYCPDYEIRRWDEKNFDFTNNDYAREAYEHGYWAFVSDFARVKIIYENGGIYLDTDVEIIRNPDDLLKYDAFCGFEDETHIMIGTFGAKKGNPWVKKLLESYTDRHFVLPNGKLDLTTNVMLNTNILTKEYRVRQDNTMQIFGENMVVLPSDYLIAVDMTTRSPRITPNTYTLHHYSASWTTPAANYYLLPTNRWMVASKAISWKSVLDKYVRLLPKEHRNYETFRFLLASRLIQEKYNWTREELVAQFEENKYFQYFCTSQTGYSRFPLENPYQSWEIVENWLTVDKIREIRDFIIATAARTVDEAKQNIIKQLIESAYFLHPIEVTIKSFP